MFSLLGWTPFLRRALRARQLSCGCAVGVYETRDGEIVEIIDATGAGCPHQHHAVDVVLQAAGGPDRPGHGERVTQAPEVARPNEVDW